MSGLPAGLSVIICTWNRSATLRAALASLAQQAGPAGVALEVIVVDNNSSDDTAAVLDQLAPGWTLGTLRRVFEPRQGKQFALNSGIAASSGAVLAFTDDDIDFPPGWLAAVWTTFADPALQLAGGKTLLAWPGGGPPPWYQASMEAILAGVDIGDRRLAPAPPEYAPAGSNMAARRSLFDQVGGFAESHFRHMDYEFGLRCQRAGVAIAYEPALVVWAPVDAQLLSKRYFRRWSFKAGFANAAVPRWVYRQFATDLLRLPLDWLRGAPAPAFARELHLWRSWGTIASGWQARHRPATYPAWVQQHSQKKKNLY